MDEEELRLLNIALAATDALHRCVARHDDRYLRDVVSAAVDALHDVARATADHEPVAQAERVLRSV